MTTFKSAWENLSPINVNDKVEKKNGLTYLSWAWAWSEVMKRYPDATYELIKFNGLPYVSSEIGLMVYTRVNIGGLTHEMWLPVMDYKNDAMKTECYSYKSRNKEIFVAAATMFDVNKAIMRCLAKNLAMFGLGIYIYAGEDLPCSEQEEIIEINVKKREALIKAIEYSASYGTEAMRLAWERLSSEDIILIGNDEKKRIYQMAKAADNGTEN